MFKNCPRVLHNTRKRFCHAFGKMYGCYKEGIPPVCFSPSLEDLTQVTYHPNGVAGIWFLSSIRIGLQIKLYTQRTIKTALLVIMMVLSCIAWCLQFPECFPNKKNSCDNCRIPLLTFPSSI